MASQMKKCKTELVGPGARTSPSLAGASCAGLLQAFEKNKKN